MFTSHLDDSPIATSPSALGQDPAEASLPVPAGEGSRDVAIPQHAGFAGKWTPLVTIVVIAAVTYAITSALSNRPSKK